jgi:cholesterol transport system auxiliary component
MNRLKTSIWLLTCIALVLAGCSSFPRSQVTKRYYALDVPTPPDTEKSGEYVLQIARFRVSRQAQSRGLTYRISDLQYETDYYNEFLVPPENMFAEEAREHMAARGLFESVISKSSLVFPDYVLEGAVARMYGDYRNPSEPMAVLELDLFLLKTDAAEPKIVLQRSYSKKTKLEKASPRDLVAGYSRLAGEIFIEFEDEVRRSGVLTAK